MSEQKIKVAIESKKEIVLMVDTFYDKVKQDALIGPIFTDTAKVNWEEHLPKLYNFWEDLLLGTDHYLFFDTIDENFTGLKANEAKERALRIAKNFSVNLGLSQF